MKKLISLILALSIILCSFSFAMADRHILTHYSLFIDGEFYNSFFNAGFDFDTQMFDIYLYDDFTGALFCKEEWYRGQRISSGMIEVTYKSSNGSFSLIFDDGSSFDGYWDENDEDLWLNLGGAYFRFCPVHSFDIQKDLKGT